MAITVNPYSDVWVRLFEQERLVLAQALAPWMHEEGVQHVGSTSVPGLSAKPIIDMLCAVKDLGLARAASEPLQELGYQPGVHRPGEAHWFYKDSAAGVRTHHLHLTVPGSSLWRERLAFRDALRADPALAAEYERLKVALCAKFGTTDPAYTDGKRALIASVLATAGIDLRKPNTQVIT